MKIIRLLSILLLGFVLGWYFSGLRTQSLIKKAFPEEMYVVAEYLGPMSEEELDELMQDIRSMVDQIINEFDRQTLWKAMTAERLETELRENGIPGLKAKIDELQSSFVEEYRQGMELGEWQEVADAFYLRNIGDENQTDQGNPTTIPKIP